MSPARKRVQLRFLVIALVFANTMNVQAKMHPLDPLDANEIKTASSVLSDASLLGDGWFLQELALVPPPKAKVFANATDLHRLASAVLVNHSKNKNVECVVDLTSKKIVSTTPITTGQPALMENEANIMAKLIQEDPRFAKAMNERGITKLSDVHIEPWGVGDVRNEIVDNNHRLIRALFYYRGESKNPYARPIEGVSTIVDLTTNSIAAFIDTEKKPLSAKHGDFFKEMGPDAKLVSHQPSGMAQPSKDIKIEGNEVSWKNWRFHVGVHYREGLVVSMLQYNDHGKLRPVLYRGSISEMVVPYADPSRHWYWRAAFDQGEYSVGPMTHSLTPGVHVPHDALLRDVILSTFDGGTRTVPNGLAIYERDGGLLWSHMDYVSGDVAAKRGRELVVYQMFTVGNYDYGLAWVFKEDGVVDVQAYLTGIISVKGGDAEICVRCKRKPETTRYVGKLEDDFGSVVDHNLIGITHQHFFNFRLDFSVDGDKNSVAEVDFERLEDRSKNQHGNMFVLNKKILRNEQEGGRDALDAAGRRWVVFNPNIKNSLGHNPGYVIVPGTSAHSLQMAHSKVAERASFLKHQLWVTQFDPNHRFVAGTYPNQNPGDGVQRWVKRNANIFNEDIVAWYTMGLIHIPCPEDWPVMPVTKAGFSLKPMSFFTQNPTLTLSEDPLMAQN